MSRSRPRRRPASAPAPAASNLIQVVTLVLAAVCLLGLFATPVSDTDFWWHLKTGQYIATHHALPVPDPFAYPAAPASEEPVRHFNLTHEWLSQLLLYGVYSLGGISAVVLVRALLLAAICALAGILAARLSSTVPVGLAAAFATASVLVSFTADRPGVVTFLGVAVFIYVLEFRRGLWALPPLALLWANCHGGFFLGWLILIAYLADSLLARERGPLWLIVICAIFASGINPNGFRVVSTVFEYRRSPMTSSLVEWQPSSLWGAPYAFDLLLYAAVLTLLISWRKVRPVHWILFAAFAAASLSAFRNTPLIGFLAPVLIAAYFPYYAKLPRLAPWVPPLILAAAVVAIFARSGGPRLSVEEWTIPEGAASFLAEHHLPGPMFNTYEQGGYLIWRLWPDYRVFIDGRSLSETVYRDYREIVFNPGSAGDQIAGARAALLNRYGIQVVVMNTMDFASGAMYPLAIALANPATADWDLVYDDAEAVVFARQPSTVPALSNKLGRVLRHLDRECEIYIENAPDTYHCAATLADYWLRNQAWDAARHMLVLYLAHTPHHDE